MVHEPRFTAELLASLLAIPPNKTLLRRHLSTHFQELVGRDKISEKRQVEASSGFVPLTATSKLKVTNNLIKKILAYLINYRFSHRRRVNSR